MGDTARGDTARARLRGRGDPEHREFGRGFDREDETASRPPPRTASSHDRGDRELAPGRGAPPGPWGDDQDDADEVDDAGDVDGVGVPPTGFLAPIQDMRFVRQSPRTTNDKITYAIHGAYAMPESFWRTANILFAYTVAPVGHVVCDAIKWALFDRLSRALLAVPVLIALLFVLNQIPLVEWLIPDQWDISTAFSPDDAPGTVEVPIDEVPIDEAPVAGGE